MSSYTIPNVIAQHPRGERIMDVYSHLLTERIVYLGTPIDPGVANTLIAQLLHLEAESAEQEINLYVNCEGGEFTLGSVQALPSGARPVTKWRNRHEAFDSIAEGVSKLVEQLAAGAATWGETTVALAPPPPPAAPVPELLPYLCDRVLQEKILRGAVNSWRATQTARRPLVCIVHGGDDEAIDMFKRRLHEVTLPSLL